MNCPCCERHHCEPDRYPTELPDTWTCPDCEKRYAAYVPEPAFAAKYRIPDGTIGWKEISA